MNPVVVIAVLGIVALGFTTLFPIFMQAVVTWQNERAYRRRPDGGAR